MNICLPAEATVPMPLRALFLSFTVGRSSVVVLSLALALPLQISRGLAEGPDYLKEIKPLLQSRCTGCHGALKQKARLRLDTVRGILQGGKSGPAIRSGEAEQSLLVQRVAQTNLDERMPPEHEGEALSGDEVGLLRRWIAAGAQAPADEKPETDPKDHWAFRPCVRPPLPAVINRSWVKNPIDAFLSQKHEQQGLVPQPQAPDSVLLRRLYMDLVGLPPTPDEIGAFVEDSAPGGYERTVARLLNDPRHGERWARHWMDIWRYSDWWGLGQELRNSQKHIWHWRDWIVESLNADTPYDEMVRLMLAADESHPGDPDKLRATGFLARNYFLFNRDRWLEETVEHVGKGFLGLSLNCAKCHDHKYDPIAQKDFYRMRAFFEPYQVRLDLVPGETDLSRDGLPRAFDARLDAPTYRFVRGLETQPDKSETMTPGVPAFLAFKDLAIHSVQLPAQAWQPERHPWVLDAYLDRARRELSAAEAAACAARQAGPVAAEPSAQPVSHRELAELAELAAAVALAEAVSIERRCAAMRATWAVADAGGRSTNAGLALAEVERAAAAIRAEREVARAKARLALTSAEWRELRAAADRKQAAEKEVCLAGESLEKANRMIDAPIKSGDAYTRLPGAKWTTTRFIHPDRDDPGFEFPPTSSGRRTALADWITDRRNPLTARVAVNHLWTRHMGTPLVSPVFEFGRKGQISNHPELLDWLASELIESGWSLKHLHRLIVTSAAYRMSSSLKGGEAAMIKDPDNRYWWRRAPIRLEAEVVRDSLLALAGTLDPTRGGAPVPPGNQADSKRRSLYFFHSNNEQNLFLATFDEAGVVECYQREQSIVPQQALALSNSAFVHDAAGLITARISRPGASDRPRSIEDSEFVRDAFRTVLGVPANDAQVAASLRALRAWRTQETAPGSEARPDGARVHLMWALLNQNDFVTLR